MIVEGFQLPAAFVELVGEGGINANNWDRPNTVDAYGNGWQAELEVHLDRSQIEWANAHVEQYFAGDPRQPLPGRPEDFPGSIPYIADFSEIVCFGTGSEGNPYCFDYRENQDPPSIIYWDDAYWRRVAPEFETLLALYEPEGQDLPGSELGEPHMGGTQAGEGTTGPPDEAPEASA